MKSFSLNFWGTDLVLDNNFCIHMCYNKLPIDSSLERISYGMIGLITKGSMDIEIDCVKYQMKAGMVLSLFPTQIIEQKQISNDLEIMYFSCSSELLSRILFRFPPEFELFLKEYPTYNASRKIFARDMELFKLLKEKSEDYDNICRNEIVMSYIRCFYLDIYNNLHHELLTDPIKNLRGKEIMKLFVNLIQKHYNECREVAFYAEKLNITPKYLSIVTKEVGGKNAKKIIDDYIITEVKLLLKSTNKSIQEIAEDLRFPDQSFLCKYFKLHTGVTPKQYRRN